MLGWGTQNAPAQRSNDGRNDWVLLAVDATFDGAAATASFVPAVQIVSDAGEEVGVFPLQDTLAAGDSASITFAPFLRSSAASGSGIQFDTEPQIGNWLEIETTGSDPTFSAGFALTTASDIFVDSTGGNVSMFSDTGAVTIAGNATAALQGNPAELQGGSDVNIEALNNNVNITAGSGTAAITGFDVQILIGHTDPGFQVNTQASGTLLEIWNNGAIGFYGAAPVTQQGHPTTLADVITVLQNVGLTA